MSATETTTPTFRISALAAEGFAPLFALSDAVLAARGIRRVVADEKPGFPCRVSLEDAEVGETLLLLHHLHHDVPGPYRASGPIYVRARAATATPAPGEVPASVRGRLLSYRSYDADGMLRMADVAEGRDLESIVGRMFADPSVHYLHVHNARPGCYSCRIDRA
jgi:uncharacterized protein DUF1203